MNKRLLTAIIMISAVVVLGMAAIISTCIIADNVEEKAKQLQNGPTDAEDLKLFEEQWERYEKLLSCYTRHSEIENIGGSVRTLDVLLQEDEELFRIECNKIITAVRHMKNTEIPYLKNIF